MVRYMKFILQIFKGILIGAGGILPGISSGVFCVIFGIYDKLIDSILNFFKNPKQNFLFLLPFIIGGIIGVIFISKILEKLLNIYPFTTKSLFIGLILGGIILILKDILKKEKYEKKNLIYLVFTFAIGMFMVYLENKVDINNSMKYNFFYFILSGFLMSIGIVVPGISSTIILMLLGVYSIYLSAISNLYFPVLIPIAIGMFIGGIIFMKIIKILLDKYYTKTMFSIIGFSIGSIFVLFPKINSTIDIFYFVMCISCGYILSSSLKYIK